DSDLAVDVGDISVYESWIDRHGAVAEEARLPESADRRAVLLRGRLRAGQRHACAVGLRGVGARLGKRDSIPLEERIAPSSFASSEAAKSGLERGAPVAVLRRRIEPVYSGELRRDQWRLFRRRALARGDGSGLIFPSLPAYDAADDAVHIGHRLRALSRLFHDPGRRRAVEARLSQFRVF